MGKGVIFGSSPFPVPPKSLKDPLSPQAAPPAHVGGRARAGGTSARILLIYVLVWHSAAVVEAWAAGAVPCGPCAGCRPGILSRLIRGALRWGGRQLGVTDLQRNGMAQASQCWAGLDCRLPAPAAEPLTLPSLTSLSLPFWELMSLISAKSHGCRQRSLNTLSRTEPCDSYCWGGSGKSKRLESYLESFLS